MGETETLMDRLGLCIPDDWTVDAVSLVETYNTGWKSVLLAYDVSQCAYYVADIEAGETELSGLSDPYVSGDEARRAYSNRCVARLFRHYNSKAPGLSFSEKNEEDK